MYAYDLHQIVLEQVKKLNELGTQKLFYHGIIYKNASSLELYCQHAGAILARAESTGCKRHVLLFATNTVKKPVHWCLDFIDLDERIYIHYNPLAKRVDVDMTLCSVLNTCLSEHERLEFCVNPGRKQGSSQLCGVFAFDMMCVLARTPSGALREKFLALTATNEQIDDEMRKQAEFFLDNSTESSSFMRALSSYNNYPPTTKRNYY
jgi:hypothetical protein